MLEFIQLLLVAIVIGGMVTFQILFAPLVFIKLPNDVARPFLSTRTTADLIQEYLHLTRDVMPALAKHRNAEQGRARNAQWPVQYDHCFQRIVLDNICRGAWYDYIKAPAYQNMSATQAEAAVRLCHQIIGGEADLKHLNERSLKWRQKQYRFSF